MSASLAFLRGESDAAPRLPAHEACVFLHGFGGVAAQWKGWLNAFAPQVATLAFDLPGHGASLDYPGYGPPKTAARAVIADTGAMGFERLHLVGHSMGGAVASLMALFEPDRIASLTLLAPGGYGTGINHDLLMRWAATKDKAEIEDLVPNFFGPSYEVHPKLVEFITAQRARPELTDRLQDVGQGLARKGEQGTLPVDDIMALPIPKDVVWGTKDAVLPVEQAEALRRHEQAGHVRLHIVEGMGHSPAEEARPLVTRIINRHLGADPTAS